MASKKSTPKKSAKTTAKSAKKTAVRTAAKGTDITPVTATAPAKSKAVQGSSRMRKNGYKIMQVWVKPGLKNAFTRRASDVGKNVSDLMREALSAAADKYGKVKFDGEGKRKAKTVATTTAVAPAKPGKSKITAKSASKSKKSTTVTAPPVKIVPENVNGAVEAMAVE